VCRSLFARYTRIFPFLLVLKLQQAQGRVDPLELRFLLAGGTLTSLERRNPAPAWLSDKALLEVLLTLTLTLTLTLVITLDP